MTPAHRAVAVRGGAVAAGRTGRAREPRRDSAAGLEQLEQSRLHCQRDVGSRVYLVLSTSKAGRTVFKDAVQYLGLGRTASSIVDDSSASVTYAGGWGHASGEAGPYAGSNSYSDVADDTATLSFTGIGVKVHAVTAPSHGIAAISVDGGAETLVDEYSAVRTGDVTVWSSPELASGPHTIRVRVTGTKRAESEGGWVTVDRFEVAG